MKEVKDAMETAASTADFSTARQNLVDNMEKLREGLAAPAPLDHSLGETQDKCSRYFIILKSFSTIIFVCMYMYVYTICVYVFVCMYVYMGTYSCF